MSGFSLNSKDLSGIGMTSRRTRIRLVQRLREQGIRDKRVLEVMEQMPRHLFIDEALAHRAYEDTALPIGFQQTISQPFIVAHMTELLVKELPAGEKFDKALEVGTGSGYQAAIFSPFAKTLHTVERIRELRNRASQRLRKLNIRNVYAYHDDGVLGLPNKAPFNVIIVTASPPEIPEALLNQLTLGGRMVIPVGHGLSQKLMLIKREAEDQFKQEIIEAVRFVPLVAGLVS